MINKLSYLKYFLSNNNNFKSTIIRTIQNTKTEKKHFLYSSEYKIDYMIKKVYNDIERVIQ